MGRRISEERGSLPMAMLAVIVVAGVASVVLATVIGGQKQTRFDQSFEQALTSAEVGLDRLISRVESGLETSTFDVAGDDYAATAERVGLGWVLTAEGEGPDGTTRTLQAQVAPRTVFTLAAFGKVVTDFNGANGADSYKSGEFTSHDPKAFDAYGYATYLNATNVLIPPNGDTGKGIVATNGRLALKGQAFAASDGAEIHFTKSDAFVDDPMDGATGECIKAPVVCDAYQEGNVGKLRYYREPIELDDVEYEGVPTGHFDGENQSLAPGKHYFTSAKLYESTEILGTPENPTEIYLTGQLSVDNHQKINFETLADGRKVPRPSPSLLIQSISEGVAMQFATHVEISAAIYAPNGAFGGGSQGHIWGSLIVGSIDNPGGWQFHYDEALADVVLGARQRVTDWVEL